MKSRHILVIIKYVCTRVLRHILSICSKKILLARSSVLCTRCRQEITKMRWRWLIVCAWRMLLLFRLLRRLSPCRAEVISRSKRMDDVYWYPRIVEPLSRSPTLSWRLSAATTSSSRRRVPHPFSGLIPLPTNHATRNSSSGSRNFQIRAPTHFSFSFSFLLYDLPFSLNKDATATENAFTSIPCQIPLNPVQAPDSTTGHAAQ